MSIEVVPEKLVGLAQEFLTSSQDMADAWSTAQGTLTVAGTDAGDTPGAAAFVTAHGEAAEAAGTALGRLVSVLELDMDDLYQCAFAYSCTDEAAAGKLESSFPAPPDPQPGPAPTPTPSS